MDFLNTTHCKSLVIDDDSASRKVLIRMLKKYPELSVVGEAENISSALNLINTEKPDSVFLDIKLKHENAFDLIHKIPPKTRVIFVSGYEKYALKAFEIDAFDYIKKPFDAERLGHAVKKLLNDYKLRNAEYIQNGNNHKNVGPVNSPDYNSKGVHSLNHQQLKYSTGDLLNVYDEDDEIVDEKDDVSFNPNHNGNKFLEYDDRIFVTTENISRFLKISHILCITAEKDYTYILTQGGKKYLVLKSMMEWEERLTPKYFVRIHRSTIVNLEYIEKVERWFNYSYQVFVQGIPEPFQMSRRYSTRLKEKFK